MERVLCCKCRKKVEYTLRKRTGAHAIAGILYEFPEEYATCNECNEEVTVPGLDDKNIIELEKVYEEKKKWQKQI